MIPEDDCGSGTLPIWDGPLVDNLWLPQAAYAPEATPNLPVWLTFRLGFSCLDYSESYLISGWWVTATSKGRTSNLQIKRTKSHQGPGKTLSKNASTIRHDFLGMHSSLVETYCCLSQIFSNYTETSKWNLPTTEVYWGSESACGDAQSILSCKKVKPFFLAHTSKVRAGVSMLMLVLTDSGLNFCQ